MEQVLQAWPEHKAGNAACPGCSEPPHPCTCGGLIHHVNKEYPADNGNGDILLVSKACDSCDRVLVGVIKATK